MEVGALGTKEPIKEWHEEPETWVDSFGKYGNAKGVGKAGGAGGAKGKDQPVDKAERTCNCCGIKGHYARECGQWDKPSDTPGKTKGQVYELKRAAFKGKKGGGKAKGKGKKGKGKINSWETEESWEGEWPEEAAGEQDKEGDAVDGEAAALDIGLSGDAFDEDEYPVLGMTAEKLKSEFEIGGNFICHFGFSENSIAFLYCRLTCLMISRLSIACLHRCFAPFSFDRRISIASTIPCTYARADRRGVPSSDIFEDDSTPSRREASQCRGSTTRCCSMTLTAALTL